MVYGIVVGGHDADPAPDQSGGLRVYFPGIHGKDVQVEHLAFSPRIVSPSKSGQQEFPGGVDPGTLVVAMKDTGSNYCQILGLAADLNKADERIPGNTDLMTNVTQYLNQTIGVRLPPTIYETVENGVRVRKIREKGYHSHNALRGLPTHGALYDLSGSVVPRVSNIPSAKQGFDNILTGSILGSLPGIAMTLGKAFNLMQQSGLFNNILKKVPSGIGQAIQSFTGLIQNIETMERTGFAVGGRVDQATYLANAASLLTKSRTIGDVVGALGRLQRDPTLFGTEKLTNTVVNTGVGVAANVLKASGVTGSKNNTSKISISPTGSIMRYIPKEVKQVINTALRAVKFLGNIFPALKTFGDSAERILRMLYRLTPVSLAFALAQFFNLNMNPQVMRHVYVATTAVTGGNPFLVI